jgi:ribose/xylose/arabinose/galactoside ABC-type transport system permease subunit
MKPIKSILASPSVRPYILLLFVAALFAFLDRGEGRLIGMATAYSVLQQFATLGPIALALGLTMMTREFDLSIGGTLSLAGCVAVLAGSANPALGLLLALAVGAIAGLTQGYLMLKLRLSSIGVTLGGLLTLSGLSYVITNNETIGFDAAGVAAAMSEHILGVFSVRSLVALALFLVAAFVVSWTRAGRDLLAVGSDRRAATIAGVSVRTTILCVFAVSGLLTAGTGALLSYSLAAASPVALADTLLPAAAAAIIGGVSLSGGKGRPLGIAGGVLVLCVLRSGLTAIGAPPFVHDIATGAVLLIVALMDSAELDRRLFPLRASLRALLSAAPARRPHP